MKVQEMNDVRTLINANIALFNKDPDMFVPYGTDMLTKSQLNMFDSERDRVYKQYKK